MAVKINKSATQWQKILSPEVYHITREQGTEEPYSGEYNDFNEIGNYYCANCNALLFTNHSKFASHCGWPAFFAEAQAGATVRRADNSYGMIREEVVCSVCDAHLGHVFPDGPPPTGERYCINSLAMIFKAQQD